MEGIKEIWQESPLSSRLMAISMVVFTLSAITGITYLNNQHEIHAWVAEQANQALTFVQQLGG